MNKGLIAALLIGLMALTGGFVLLSGDDDETATSSQQPNQTTQTTPASNTAVDDESTVAQTTGSGAYVDYSESVLAETADTERVLFFHAEWCSVCNFHEGQIERSGVPEGITVIKADYDSEDALKDQYGVTVQSTFIWLDDNGNARQSWPFANGLRTPQDLFDVVQAG